MKIYIVGIGGAGTSALAAVYHKRGHEVSGSDMGDGFYTTALEKMDIVVHKKFDAVHIIDDLDLIVHSTAIDENAHCELIAARSKNINIITYPEAIGRLTRKMRTIAVCGTHGKTTVAALTTHAFIETRMKPTAIVGSRVIGWNTGGYVGGEDCFVIEADEYQNKLALYEPCCVIVTSIDYDHPDFFSDMDAYKKVFAQFVERIPSSGCLVVCGDDVHVRDVVKSSPQVAIYYGTGKQNDYQIIARDVQENGQTVHVKKDHEQFEFFTRLHGEHNAKNALAALIIATGVTGERDKVKIGIGKCAGTARRFEQHATVRGAIVVDDYAHHPEEIRATLATAREVFPQKKLIVAFHPHTFTRTKALLSEFAQTLNIADQVIVLDIYGSAREIMGDIDATSVVDAINALSQDKAQHVPTIHELAPWMQKNLTSDDVFFTLGAGDIWQVYDLIAYKK